MSSPQTDTEPDATPEPAEAADAAAPDGVACYAWFDPAPDVKAIDAGGLLSLIEADLGEDAAMTVALKIKEELPQQFLNIANDAPRTVRLVFQ